MTVTIDCSEIQSKEDFHRIFSKSLHLPGFYGSNLDALHDCLTDIFEPTEIRLVHAAALADRLGLYAEVLHDVLRDACEENQRLQLIWED